MSLSQVGLEDDRSFQGDRTFWKKHLQARLTLKLQDPQYLLCQSARKRSDKWRAITRYLG